MRYAVVVHKEPSSSYGVSVPDLPGCFSGGDTLEEAFEQVREAIVGHLETLRMVGQPIPDQASLELHLESEYYKDGLCWGYVDAEIPQPSKSVRVNVTIPEAALERIDKAAASLGQSRSALLTRAALEYVSAVDA